MLIHERHQPRPRDNSIESRWRRAGVSSAVAFAAFIAVLISLVPLEGMGQIPPQSQCPPTPPSAEHYCGRVGGVCDEQVPCRPALYAWHRSTYCCYSLPDGECRQYLGQWWCCPPKDGMPAGWRSACVYDGVLSSDRCIDGIYCED